MSKQTSKTFQQLLESIRDRLYAAIAHGDEDHRGWLKNKLQEFFAEEAQVEDGGNPPFVGYRAVSAAYWRRRALKAEGRSPQCWRPINEMDLCDDLMWFAKGDSIEGPRRPDPWDYDRWTWYCPAEAPALPEA